MPAIESLINNNNNWYKHYLNINWVNKKVINIIEMKDLELNWILYIIIDL